MSLRLLVFITILSIGYFGLAADAIPKSFQGTWEFVEMTTNGTRVNDQSFVHYRWVFRGDRVTIFYGEREVVQLRCEVDASVTPARFDTWYDGADESLKAQYPDRVKGILRLTNEGTLIRCYGQPGGERPAKFESSREANTVLLVTKRAGAKSK